MRKFKKVLSAVLVAAFMLCCANQGTIFAAVNGNVTGTLNEKSVYGKLTCNEVAHHLAIRLIYDVRSTLTGEAVTHTVGNDAFGNNTQVSKTAYAGRYESMSYLRTIGSVDDSKKCDFYVSSYGTTTREYW